MVMLCFYPVSACSRLNGVHKGQALAEKSSSRRGSGVILVIGLEDPPLLGKQS